MTRPGSFSGPVRLLRAGARWGLGHAAPRAALHRAAADGDLHGRMFVATSRGDTDTLWEVVSELREAGTFYRGRYAAVTVDHEAVRAVLAHPDLSSGFPTPEGSSALSAVQRWAVSDAPLGPLTPPSLLVTEPPDHTRYRRLVSRVFTARAVEDLRARTEEIAARLLDAVDPTQQVDLMSAYCSLLPVTVIAEILGVPAEDRDLVLRFGGAAAPSLDLGIAWSEFRTVERALREFDDWLQAHVERLAASPGDDLLSRLVAVHEDGQGLSATELRSTAGLVLAAGFETTVNLLGNATALLDAHPEQRRLAAEQPELWPNVVEEVLRFDPPVLLTGRVATAPVEVLGTPLPAGSPVVAMLAGANRDPAVFADPDRFDVSRAHARDHVSFSAGRHFCLGAALARMEGEVGLRTLFTRFPRLRVEGEARRRPTRILRGFSQLPVTLEPAGARPR